MRRESGTGAPPPRFRGTTPVLWPTAPSPTGKSAPILNSLRRSEGSLNQHVKLKHPEFYKQQASYDPQEGNYHSGPLASDINSEEAYDVHGKSNGTQLYPEHD